MYWLTSGTLWWDVVNRRGKTGWHAALFVLNLCPLTRDACATLSTVENRDPSAKLICHWLSDPLECLDNINTFGVSMLSLWPGEFLPIAFAVKFGAWGFSAPSKDLLSDSYKELSQEQQDLVKNEVNLSPNTKLVKVMGRRTSSNQVPADLLPHVGTHPNNMSPCTKFYRNPSIFVKGMGPIRCQLT